MDHITAISLSPAALDIADAADSIHQLDVILGTSGNDFLQGTDGDDRIKGLGGDDFLAGGFGADLIVGGGGDDVLTGVSAFNPEDDDGASNTLDGGAGNDELHGGSGADRLIGGAGADLLIAGAGNDIIDGGYGVDTATIVLQSFSEGLGFDASGFKPGGINHLTTGFGETDKFVGVEQLVVYGTQFDDTLIGSRGNDTIFGGSGRDPLSGADLIDGGGGDDAILVTRGDSTISGGSGDDAISITWGGSGSYLIDGGRGSDSVQLGLSGVGAPVYLSLVHGDLTVEAGGMISVSGSSIEAVDVIGGNMGDNLSGGGGNDTLDGWQGADTLTGGDGSDSFAFDNYGLSAKDLITDLSAEDTIDLSLVDAIASSEGDDAFTIVHRFDGRAGQLMLTYNAAEDLTKILGDTDGDGKADMVILLSGDHRDFEGFIL